MIKSLKFDIAALLSTVFGIGNIKYAPGTFGSAITFPLFLLINKIMSYAKISDLLNLFFIYFAIVLILMFIANWSIGVYIGINKKDDPSEVIIDEVIGQLIAYMIPFVLVTYYYSDFISNIFSNAIVLSITSLIMIFTPFLFFRIFDILKIGLVGYIDSNIHGPVGIIMDDVIAGLYAGCTVCLLISSFLISVAYFAN